LFLSSCFLVDCFREKNMHGEAEVGTI
jgi:hypothetical protein